MSFMQRTELLLNEHQIKKIKEAHVAVFGLGGVGGYSLEALVRAGIGTLTIVDGDKIEETNINRQILTNYSYIGQYKTDVAEKRIKEINPQIKVHKLTLFITKDTLVNQPAPIFNYAIDAIDSVESKVDLLEYLYHKNIPTISCMGAGLKLNPLAITASDISKTHTCPLAKIIRRKLAEKNIYRGITCVFSTEKPIQQKNRESEIIKNRAIGSISYIPGIIGLTASGLIIRKIIGLDE